MKKTVLFLLLIPTLSFSQFQIGVDIDGENNVDWSGTVSLSSDGSTVAIGAPRNDANGTDSGHVRVYENLSGVWTQIGSDIDGEGIQDNSGYSVSLSADGSIVAIGAPYNDGVNGEASGHVRVYENISNVWTQIGTDIDGEAPSDQFGFSVSLSEDGSTLAIGATTNDGNGSNSGSVRVYKNQGGVWIQIGADIDGESPEDRSGISISLSSDGSTLGIGAYFNDGDSSGATGHVRIYKNISNVWTQLGGDIDGENSSDRSGYSISLSSDGSIVAVGAPFNSDNGVDSGHVRVFKNISNTWTQVGGDIDGESSFDQSGYNISLSNDGSVLAVGALSNEGTGIQQGHVRLFQNISNVWTQIGTDIDGEADYDSSGFSLSLSSNGSIIAIGAKSNDGNGSSSGHVRLYNLSSILATSDMTKKYFKIYPNPTKDFITIQTNNIGFSKAYLYDLNGRLVKEINPIKETVDIQSLISGIYLLKIFNNDGASVKRIIKQ